MDLFCLVCDPLFHVLVFVFVSSRLTSDRRLQRSARTKKTSLRVCHVPAAAPSAISSPKARGGNKPLVKTHFSLADVPSARRDSLCCPSNVHHVLLLPFPPFNLHRFTFPLTIPSPTNAISKRCSGDQTQKPFIGLPLEPSTDAFDAQQHKRIEFSQLVG